MATALTSRERLASIAEVLDAAGVGCDVDLLVSVADDGDAVELGVRLLVGDDHPCDELRGVVAPDRWWAVGVVVRGRARFLDQPDGPAEPIQSTYLVARDGAEVSLLRRGAEVAVMSGPAQGRVPDACRAVLGLATRG